MNKEILEQLKGKTIESVDCIEEPLAYNVLRFNFTDKTAFTHYYYDVEGAQQPLESNAKPSNQEVQVLDLPYLGKVNAD